LLLFLKDAKVILIAEKTMQYNNYFNNN